METLTAHVDYEAPARIPDWVRRQVLDRDNGQCQACGTSGENRLQLHHWLHYRSHGGAHVPENLVTLCWQCHACVHEKLLTIVLCFVEIKQRWMAFCQWRATPPHLQQRVK